MSDLQCPATFLVLGPSASDAAGRLSGTRLAAAYAVPEGRAVATAVARVSGLPVSALETDGSSYAATLEGLADVHRGETVLVVLPQTAATAFAGGAEGSPVAAGEVLEVAVDSDGWSVRIWTSAPAESYMRD